MSETNEPVIYSANNSLNLHISPLEGLLNYLQTPGKKVILIGESHGIGETMEEIYTMAGKQINIIEKCINHTNTSEPIRSNIGSVPKSWFKNAFLNRQTNFLPRQLISNNTTRSKSLLSAEPAPLGIYTEYSQELSMSHVLTSDDKIKEANTILMRYSILNTIPMYFRSFNARQHPSTALLSRLGDDKYAADIRKLSESCDIVVAVIGLGHIPVISNLLLDLNPYLINTTTDKAVKYVYDTYTKYGYLGLRLTPNYQTMPVYDDSEANDYTTKVLNLWKEKTPHTMTVYKKKNSNSTNGGSTRRKRRTRSRR